MPDNIPLAVEPGDHSGLVRVRRARVKIGAAMDHAGAEVAGLSARVFRHPVLFHVRQPDSGTAGDGGRRRPTNCNHEAVFGVVKLGW